MNDPRICRLWDKGFKYTKEADSDIRKTFARIRREQAKQAAPVATVTPLKRKAAK